MINISNILFFSTFLSLILWVTFWPHRRFVFLSLVKQRRWTSQRCFFLPWRWLTWKWLRFRWHIISRVDIKLPLHRTCRFCSRLQPELRIRKKLPISLGPLSLNSSTHLFMISKDLNEVISYTHRAILAYL